MVIGRVTDEVFTVGTDIHRRLFNVDEYYRLAEAGILAPDDRVELIDGAIVEMTAIGSRHAAAVDRADVCLKRRLGGLANVRIQGPIRLDAYSQPQPDVSVLKPREDFYAEAHPGPADVILLVEVADASLRYDRDVKMGLYARASIAEVWLVDLESEDIHVFTQPSAAGYLKVVRCGRGEHLPSTVLPSAPVLVDDILG